jgi:hypothetical protein
MARITAAPPAVSFALLLLTSDKHRVSAGFRAAGTVFAKNVCCGKPDRKRHDAAACLCRRPPAA